MNLNIHLDRTVVTGLPELLSDQLSSMGLVEEGEVKRVSFCGMVMLNQDIHIFLPRSSDYQHLNDQRKITLAAAAIKAVEKYGREKSTRVDLRDENDGAQGLSHLSLIRNILDDFINYGIYTRRKVIRCLNNAKPDWNRTISRSPAAIGKGGRPVYLDIHCVRKQYFSDSEVSAIHSHIIRELDRNFSWILTGKAGLFAPELNDYPDPVSSVQHQIYILQKELHQTFAERDIRLLKFLIRYLGNKSGTDNSSFIAGVRSFHFAWEHMIRQVLTGVVEINHLLPAPCYTDESGKVIPANEKSMRTDIVLSDHKNDMYAVIDAKYYAATSPGNAPGWGDLVKQFFYAKALKLIRPESRIRNIFLFPGTRRSLTEARVRNRTKSPDHFYDEEFSPVECFYISPVDVIENYSAGKKMKDLSPLFLTRPL
jgi:hypothetical protein